jgi:hypothetical protein
VSIEKMKHSSLEKGGKSKRTATWGSQPWEVNFQQDYVTAFFIVETSSLGQCPSPQESQLVALGRNYRGYEEF